MEEKEKVIFNNSFGTITDKTITYRCHNINETIKLETLTSVEYKREPQLVLSIILIVLSIISFSLLIYLPDTNIIEKLSFLFSFILLFTIGIGFYLGPHKIKIRAKGQYLNPIKVSFFRLSQGKRFYIMVRKQLLNYRENLDKITVPLKEKVIEYA